MTAEQKKEFTRKISQANSSELIVILYDIALVYVKESISLSGLITIVRADMSKTKKVFVSYMNGYTMLSGRSELAWELI